MKKFVFCLAAAVLAGCGGVSKEQLDTLKAELLANDVSTAAELEKKVTGVDAKYVRVQQLELEVRRRLEELAELEKQLRTTSAAMDEKVTRASTSVVRMLEFEEKLLSERLATIRDLIAELKQQ